MAAAVAHTEAEVNAPPHGSIYISRAELFQTDSHWNLSLIHI